MAQLLDSPAAPAACVMRLAGILMMMMMMMMMGSSLTLAEHREPVMFGGLQDVPVSDPGVQEAAQFAISAYNQRSNSLYYSRATKILRARTQVVAGVKYYLTVELVNTVCEKRGGSGLNHVDLQRCALQSRDKQQRQICEFQVWSRAWLNDTRLLSMTCNPAGS